MPRTLSKQLVISQADGTLPHRYDILVDTDRELQWFEGSDSEDTVRAGQPVIHKWNFFGGGACETVDMGRGGYFFSTNCTVCNPFRIRPRPETTSITLTSNATPVTQFFEAKSASGTKYLYPVTDTKAHKIRLLDQTLVNTKDFSTPDIEFATGSYTGTGADQTISIGFTPKFVFTIGDGVSDYGLIKSDTMPTNSYKYILGTYATGSTSNGVAFSGSSMLLYGNAGTANYDEHTYRWIAFGGIDSYVATDSFTGDGNDDTDITIADPNGGWGQPDGLFIWTDNSSDPVCFRTKTDTSDETWDLANENGPEADIIEAQADWPTNGFEVGTDNRANRSGATVYYLALKTKADILEFDTYNGDGNDDRSISGLGYEPTWVLVCGNLTEYPVHRSDKMGGDSSMIFGGLGLLGPNYIQALESDGFQVGTDDIVNKGAGTPAYYWMAVRTDPTVPTCGQPAEWNDIVELPRGDDVDWVGLTTIVDGTGDDTWTTRTDLKATHFCTLRNKIARAYSDRSISLCSADDVSTSGNWGAAYNIGPPGTVITYLNQWGVELAVSATDGMYMFDGVATSKQQLPLMGGIKDDENGKGTLNWLGQVLVPTKGGLLRWQFGTARPVGPDSIFGFVEAEGVSNEPIHLQHFGLTYLEDWIYEAVYDGTNYHIIYGRPSGEGFRWDFLLTSSSAIKTLFVDSNARLWFGLGNNISWIQLRRSGAPTGGNYGEAALTGSFYTNEKVLADGANVRCRMAKIETDNNQSTLTWKLYSIRDGATAEQVGAAAGFKTDGEQKLYWTAASNLKARRLRYRLDFACSSFTPETTPPECLSLEFRGVALPDDADVIRVVVSLDSEGRSNKTVYDELAAHENAGVRKVRSPITDETLNVAIFHRELAWVKQRGAEPPKVGIMLYMRRGDVA